MPTYCYRCDHCGGFEEFRPISQAGWTARCGKCGRECGRDLAAENAGVVADNDEYWSVSMGAADVDRLAGEQYDAQGRVRVQGRTHKRRLMRKLGVREA